MKLTNKQRNFLRNLANNIKPVVTIGQNGLSDEVLKELDSTKKAHELLKIKIRASKEQRNVFIDKIINHSNAQLVQVIGNIIVIYHAFEDNPKILLPLD
jgi:RNA-binding protein